MNIIAIIQARIGSSRLPGKVLKTVNNRPLLEIEVLRAKKSKILSDIIVATTNNSRDNIIVDFCRKNNFNFSRGSEDDVLERYYKTAKLFKANIIVRLTADCPLIDPLVIDKVIDTHISEKSDYTGNQLKLTFPRGLDVEVINFPILEIARNEATGQPEREHVTPFIYYHPERFKITNVSNHTMMGHHRWTVDTQEDFQFIQKVLCKFKDREIEVEMDEIYEYVENNPKVFNINSHIKQKEV